MSGIALNPATGAPPPTGSQRDPRSPLGTQSPVSANSDTNSPLGGLSGGDDSFQPSDPHPVFSPPPAADAGSDPVNQEPTPKSVVADYDYPNVPDTTEGQSAGTDPMAGGELNKGKDGQGAFSKLMQKFRSDK